MSMNTQQFDDAELLQAARLYENGDFDGAFPLYKSLAERGSIESQVLLGWMYQEGYGVQKDDQKAIEWFCCSAKAGAAEGEFYAGKYHARKGECGAAFAHYQRAAAKSYAPAWVKLGRMYETGRGVSHDLESAFSCYEQAALRNHIFGLKYLALLLLNGQRGLMGRFKGIWLFFKALCIAVRIGWKDPDSDQLRE